MFGMFDFQCEVYFTRYYIPVVCMSQTTVVVTAEDTVAVIGKISFVLSCCSISFD